LSPGLQAALGKPGGSGGSAGLGGSAVPPAVPLTLLPALLLALLGGLVLNLMPCVFPVLAIKLLSFTQHANDAKARLTGGLAYSLGVVLSFLALGGLLLALRAGGEALGWGFQLQSPWVVAGLAALFTLIALNLMGVFELGSVLPSSVASFQVKNPALDALLSGVLAVAVASPCTAPFMGASLGYAVGLPSAQALLIFAALGVGMALPYWVACAVPAVARALPRPGAWMDVFKTFMAFPMLATVAWLVWVLGQQSGIDGAGALLVLLTALAMLAWALGLASSGGRSKSVTAMISVVTFAIATWTFGPFVVKNVDTTAPAVAAGELWQNWEPGKVEQLVGAGQAVFVDFTAAWCVTCQLNKKTTLANTDVLASFKAKNIATLRADWTRRDPAIGAALQSLGRSGVPVYVLYQAGRAPLVFSEILSVADVQAALGGV
jgi:thiol:disulfide interchange protein DsbD